MNILVVGAGLGGLTAALALREIGADVEVFERACDLASIQAGIGMVIWPNGMRALDRHGLKARAEAVGHPIEALEFYAAGGRRLNDWPVGEVGARVGAPSLALSRGELHRAVADAYGEANIRFGRRYANHEEHTDGVTVRFEDGTTARGDILVGADGIVSQIRRKLTGHGPPEYPPYAGYTIWHAIVPDRSDAVPAHVFTLLFGRGHRFAHYRIDAERVYWSGIGFVPAGDEKIIRKADALALFTRYRAPVPALIEQTDQAQIQRHDIYGGKPLERWGAGRVTMTGDAAHPMTTNLGQGAGMAIEDGVVLAQCLARAAAPEDGLRAYEARRIARTTEMMTLANRMNSSAAMEGRLRTTVRNVMIARGFQRGIQAPYERFIEAEALA
jgi:2-polyprenyl-6-methoxyphenol hydroxylase-like FAD-dependent oxidoreductase